MVTASPAWTTAEMIGRYMPRTGREGGLEFVPGFLEKARSEKRWLIIDEFNRADMDSCFGELFTVLSGEKATIPFRKTTAAKVGASGDGEEDIADSEEEIEDFVEIEGISDDFRIIATMNDSDASRLNPLSFALRRRFVTLYIDIPEREKRAQIFMTRLREQHKIEKESSNFNPFYVMPSGKTQIKDFLCQHISFDKNAEKGIFWDLFCAPSDNLLDLKIIGIAQTLDMIDFVVESLRDPNADIKDNSEKGKSTLTFEDDKLTIEDLFYSSCAMAVSLMIIPQLDACPRESFEKAMTILKKIFNNRSFVQIEETKHQQGKYEYRAERRSGIDEYLKEELLRQYQEYDDRHNKILDIFK